MRSFLYILIIAAFVSPWFTLQAQGKDGTPHHSHHDHSHMQGQSMEPSDESVYNLDSKWRTPEGEQISIGELKGQLRIAAMLFTSCPTACPLTIMDIQNIRAKLPAKIRDSIKVTIFSLDPDRDTPQALQKFMKKSKLDRKAWLFLSPASASEVRELAAVLGVRYKKLTNGDFVHSNVIYLINKKGEVVAKHEGLKAPPKKFIERIKSVYKTK